MFCSNCGAPMKENDKFCQVCGTPVQGQSAMPVTQQAPVNQQPVSKQQVPAPNHGRPYGPQEQRKANKLCILSLILTIVVPLVFSIIVGIVASLGVFPADSFYSIVSIITLPASGAMIAGIALMIVVRVKYRKSKFGLILMIIYCVLVSLSLIIVMISATTSCSDFVGSSSCS
ncbi:MAG: zinc ribbon domain-containing protein [Clostridia bacterium]|nr:zinc ribbon domain-containing protein [Clostridia bacterium]